MKTKRFVSTLLALLLICSLPLSAFADTWYLDEGSITVNATESGQTVSQGTQVNVPDSAPVITQSNSETPTTNTVTINAAENATANVTIQDVNINTGSRGGAAIQTAGAGNAVIELDGTNTVQSSGANAGVQKTNFGNLTIADENGTDGSLKATGGGYGAGIGGGGAYKNSSDITISGGTIEAIGGDNCAGIGGGGGGSGSNITITGGKVTATGKGSASGIGGGAGNSGSNITISGGNVEATGGASASGIGGGAGGSGEMITITGSAEVTAKGGDSGAGIGGGAGNSGYNITISGSAEVTAKGGLSGAGIGGGIGGTGGVVTVSGDAQVKAQGGDSTAINETDKQGEGAAIGNGGRVNTPGAEVTPDTANLNEGWIATYAPDTTDLDTATPKSLTYRDDNGALTTSSNAVPIVKQEPTCTEDGHRAGFTVGNTQVGGETLPATGHSFTNYISNKDGSKTAKCDHCDATDTISAPGSKLVREETAQIAPLYRVIGKAGKALACKTERKDGVLTVTADADFAALTGKLGGIQTLKAQGVDTIVFVTNNATSTFALADLLSQGSTGDSYTLTHDGSTVSFTLNNGADAGTILQ